MAKIINFDSKKKKTLKEFHLRDYKVSSNCVTDAYLCLQCGKCGRKFKNGILL